jgi:hypothetical protein
VIRDQIASLAAPDFLKLQGAHDPDAQVSLTEAGRKAVIELIAAAQAIESDADRHLGVDESRVLMRWLRRIIDDSGPV